MTTSIFMNGRSQAVRLPKELRLTGKQVSIRRLGNGIFIEPIMETSWPENFFESIHIDDQGFVRPDQGENPDIPSFDEPV